MAEPRQPPPGGVHTVLTFSRMTASAYAIVRRAIEEDEVFRARVAAAATEEGVGRAGWLWLHRPEGWQTDAALETPDEHDRGRGMARLRRERDGAEAAAARHQAEASAAEASRRRSVAQLQDARREASAAVADGNALQARVGQLEAERNEAVRSLKAAEADLADARRDLRIARASTRAVEVGLELATPGAEFPTTDPLWPPAGLLAAPGSRTSTTKTPRGREKKKPPLSLGARTSLPPGLFTGTPEADRHLVSSGAAIVVVDGYNLSRAAWSGIEPEEERRRTVALLEEVQARSGGVVVVVFDGADATVAPLASRSVRVRFSATGQTADDVIRDLLMNMVKGESVLVVSSDRAVADDARRHGALVLGARQFLAAAGR